MEIPQKLPAVLTDCAQYAQRDWARLEIHVLIELGGPLDRQRLARALRLCLDAEPVLGCRLVPRPVGAFWQRFSAKELDDWPLLRLADPGRDPQEATAAFLSEPLDLTAAPQVAALLVPGGEGDLLVVKAGHFAPDAGGVKDFLRLLCLCYRGLASDPGFSLPPNLKDRGLSQVYRHFSTKSLLAGLPSMLGSFRSHISPAPAAGFPLAEDPESPPVFSVRRIPPERFAPVQDAAKRAGATVNDLMAASLMRALWDVREGNRGLPLRLAQTMDLRQLIPGGKAETVCHLTSGFFPSIGPDPGRDLAQTLARVKADIDGFKESLFPLRLLWMNGLVFGSLPFGAADRLMRESWKGMRKKAAAPVLLTNMGPIAEDCVDFGAPATRYAGFLVPPLLPPTFGVGISGFRGGITLSAGFPGAGNNSREVERLFDAMEKEWASLEHISE
ncbi:MAG: hypothetical protein AB1921_08045 [Thermodesulfobacteriota bacterium]